MLFVGLLLSCVQLFCDLMVCSLPGPFVHGISWQEYWSGLPFPSSEDLPESIPSPGDLPESTSDPELAYVSCIVKQISSHQATGEAPLGSFP